MGKGWGGEWSNRGGCLCRWPKRVMVVVVGVVVGEGVFVISTAPYTCTSGILCTDSVMFSENQNNKIQVRRKNY